MTLSQKLVLICLCKNKIVKENNFDWEKVSQVKSKQEDLEMFRS